MVGREYWDDTKSEKSYATGYAARYPSEFNYYGLHPGEWVAEEMDMEGEVIITGWVYDYRISGPFDTQDEMRAWCEANPDQLPEW